MSKYNVVAVLRSGRAVILFEESDYSKALDKTTNLVINIRDLEFFPLSQNNSSHFINKTEILEFRVTDQSGNIAYKEQDED